MGGEGEAGDEEEVERVKEGRGRDWRLPDAQRSEGKRGESGKIGNLTKYKGRADYSGDEDKFIEGEASCNEGECGNLKRRLR